MVPLLSSVSEKLLVNACLTFFGSLERIRSPFLISHKSCSFTIGTLETGSMERSLTLCRISENVSLTEIPQFREQALIEGRTGFSMPKIAAPRTTAVQLYRISYCIVICIDCRRIQPTRYLACATLCFSVEGNARLPAANIRIRRNHQRGKYSKPNISLTQAIFIVRYTDTLTRVRNLSICAIWPRINSTIRLTRGSKKDLMFSLVCISLKVKE